MSLKVRRLKIITLTIGGVSVECQLNSWKLDPGVQDGDRLYSSARTARTSAKPTASPRCR
ncbi:hypothetical protein DMP23_00045 [Amycolatopsis sp. A1MSW2902]|uniref:hypothetical protein n=1 Tax=Amycolatopsis sp. A1MSW2902 TaxID=687413 RepID=UPI00307F5626